MHLAQVRALIRWDGRTEDIVMELDVDGKPSEAAWFLPVPARASLKLGDAELFDALQELTKPEVQVEQGPAPPGGAPEGAAPVTLLERRALGPFDVSTLAASDAEALGDWLTANGYQLPEGLAPVIQPYVEQGWYYIAVRLRPGQGETLTGRLDPLWVTFPSDRIIYPMRVMQLAELPHGAYALPLFLYVLADHRVAPPETSLEGINPEWYGPENAAEWRAGLVKFAGWIDPATLDDGSPLAAVVPRTLFLTKFQIDINHPQGIEHDFLFSFADEDEPYREIEIRYGYGEADDGAASGGAGWLLAAFVIAGCLLLAVGYLAVRYRAS